MERPKSHRLMMGALLALGLAAGSCSCDEDGVRGQNPVMIASFLSDPDRKAAYLVDFGVVPIKSKAHRTIQVRNAGNTELLIKRGEIGKPFNLGLAAAGLSLGPGESTELSFEYAPTEIRGEPDELILELFTNETKVASKHSVRLVGAAALPSLSCDPLLDFGDVVMGTEKSLSLRCSNPLSSPLQVKHSFMGSSKDFFSASVEGVGEEITVEAHGSLTFLIKFRAEARGRHDLYFSMVDSHGNPLATVEVLANAVLSLLRMVPETCLDFGYVDVGSTSERSLSLENIGTDTVQILGFRFPGGGGSPYEIATPPPIAIPPASSAEVVVRFQPSVAGFYRSEFEIETDEMSGGSSFLQACATGFGGGPKLLCSPDAIDFGMVAVGMPVTIAFRCMNAGSSEGGAPTDPLMVDDIYSTNEKFHPTIRNEDGSHGAAPEGYAVEDYFFVDVTYDPAEDSFDSGMIVIESPAAPGGVYQAGVSGQGRNLLPCEFELRPPLLQFGIVDRGGQRTQDFAIENIGTDACLINDLRLSDGSDAAYSVAAIGSTELAPGAILRVPVTFAPTAYRAQILGEVQLQISNPQRPFQTVGLRGASASPCVSIEPAELDFGRIGPGCRTSERVITISNICQTPIRLEGAEINDTADADSFMVIRRPLGGRILKPRERDEIVVAFMPQDVGEFSGGVRIDVAESEPYVSTLYGEGALDAIQTDIFDQKAAPKVDILWVIDNSGSMIPYQNAIATNLPAFLTFANSQNIDFHMALTTTGLRSGGPCPGGVNGAEDGRFYPVNGSRPRILTPTTPDLEEHWASNIMVGDCHDDEQPYEAAKRALSEPLINEVKDSRYNTPWNDGNAGFLREEASLSIIMLTDERDHAHELFGNTMAPLDYVAFFRSLKGAHNPHMFKLHAITGPPTGVARTCNAEEGDRILVGVEETDGIWIDICTPMVSDNWARGLRRMSEGAFGFAARFHLRGRPALRQGGSGAPTEADIDVFIDGSKMAPINESNARVWIYDSETNSIDFTPLFIPKPGSQISASYRVACLEQDN